MPDNVVANDWSPDNRYILFQAQGRKQVARDLWALVPDGSGKTIQITSTPADETLGRISPDGRWVAYQSSASGTGLEIYVRSFPDAGREWRISTTGGAVPKWRGDGREIYYLNPDSHLMAVSLTLPATGAGVVQHDPPRALFALPQGSAFEPAADGQRFLVNAVLDEAGNSADCGDSELAAAGGDEVGGRSFNCFASNYDAETWAFKTWPSCDG